MIEEILVNITPQETRVAIIAQGVVQELTLYHPPQSWLGPPWAYLQGSSPNSIVSPYLTTLLSPGSLLEPSP